MILRILETASPFLLAALGGLLTELAGSLNIALEGLMLTGAFSAVLAYLVTGNLMLSMLFAALVSLTMAALLGYATLHLHTDIFISGLAINLLAAGLIPSLSIFLFKTKGVIRMTEFPGLSHIRLPLLDKIPLIKGLFTGYTLFIFLGIISSLAIFWLIFKTRFGLQLRACGKSPDFLHSRGLDPKRIKFTALLASGFFCGLAGANLSFRIGAFSPDITAGRGWIALVAIYLGFRNPLGILLAAYFLSLVEISADWFQGTLNLPKNIIIFSRYILIIAVYILFSILYKRKNRHRA